MIVIKMIVRKMIVIKNDSDNCSDNEKKIMINLGDLFQSLMGNDKNNDEKTTEPEKKTHESEKNSINFAELMKSLLSMDRVGGVDKADNSNDIRVFTIPCCMKSNLIESPDSPELFESPTLHKKSNSCNNSCDALTKELEDIIQNDGVVLEKTAVKNAESTKINGPTKIDGPIKNNNSDRNQTSSPELSSELGKSQDYTDDESDF